MLVSIFPLNGIIDIDIPDDSRILRRNFHGYLSYLRIILWLIIRTIIFILALIILALILIGMILMWIVLLVSVITMGSIFPGTINIYFFGFEFSSEENDFSMKYEESIQWRYVNFLDLYLPVTRKEIWQNGTLISWEESHIILLKTDLSPRNDSLIEEENPSQSSLSLSSISFYPHTSSNSSSEEISDDFKKILIGRVAAGASLAMTMGGIFLTFYGIAALIGKGGIRENLISLAIFVIIILNLLTSAYLLSRNIFDQVSRPEEDFQQELTYNAYFYGFFLGCIVTTLIFLLTAAIGSGAQNLLGEKSSNFAKIGGGIGFGLAALTLKILEATFRMFSNLWGSNVVWLTLSLLLVAGLFTTINIAANKDTRRAKWVGGAGVTFGLTALICSLLYVTMVPQQNRDVISTL